MIAPRLRILMINHNRLITQALNVSFPPKNCNSYKIKKKACCYFKQKRTGPIAEQVRLFKGLFFLRVSEALAEVITFR